MTTSQDYLQTKLDAYIRYFDAKGKRHQKAAFLLKLSVAALGAATTICLGLKFAEPAQTDAVTYATWLSNTALILSALVTVLSVGDTFFNPRALWMEYSSAEAALKALKDALEFQTSSGTISDDDRKSLFTKMQKILNDTTQAKLEARKAGLQLPPDNKPPNSE